MSNRFHNPLPGVPLVESPFFAELLDEMELDEPTRSIAVELHTKGWATVDFPEPEFDALADRIRRDLHPLYDWEHWRNAGWQANDGMRIQDAYKSNSDVQRIAANPQIIALLSTLYGRRAWPFQTLNFPVGTQQHYHSDSIHFSSLPERFMCGVWVALEDVGPTQGPLMYYSGSHKWPIYGNEHIALGASRKSASPEAAFEALWSELVRVNRLEPTHFHARKGQALIWTANLLHGGARQSDPGLTRWSQVTHYYFDGCSYYMPKYSDPFLGRILFKRPHDIVTGTVMPQTYSGRRVPAPFVWSMRLRSFSNRRLWMRGLRRIAPRLIR